jgi:glucosamine-6-phosphate deaminase
MTKDVNGMETKILKVDKLTVEIHSTRQAMGAAAGVAVAEKMHELLKRQDRVRMIFAAAPSQNEFLDSLCQAKGIDWSRVVAFHMDDYLGLPDNAEQRFSSYLKEHLFNKVYPGQVNYLIDSASSLTRKVDLATLSEAIEATCGKYSRLLNEAPVDIICMGIGENGHIAFNDPPVADFEDPKLVKLVALEERCRMQQVHDGCFSTLADVPTHALTLTIPNFTAAKWLYCMVPGPTKREAVRRTIREEISTNCPATILRRHSQARLYLDVDSAADIL